MKGGPVMRSSLVVCALFAGGCLSHLPPARHEHMRIQWQPSFAAAQARAQRENRPILACLVAGELDGWC